MPKILSRNDCVEAELRLSRLAGAFVLAGASATLAIVLATPMASDVRAWLVALIGLMTLRAYRRESRRADGAVCYVRIDAVGNVESTAGGVSRCGSLRSGCFVASWLTVIRWRPEGARFDRAILVLPDMLPADPFRRMRVLLRWGSAPTFAGKDARTAGSRSAPRAAP